MSEGRRKREREGGRRREGRVGRMRARLRPPAASGVAVGRKALGRRDDTGQQRRLAQRERRGVLVEEERSRGLHAVHAVAPVDLRRVN